MLSGKLEIPVVYQRWTVLTHQIAPGHIIYSQKTYITYSFKFFDAGPNFCFGAENRACVVDHLTIFFWLRNPVSAVNYRRFGACENRWNGMHIDGLSCPRRHILQTIDHTDKCSLHFSTVGVRYPVSGSLFPHKLGADTVVLKAEEETYLRKVSGITMVLKGRHIFCHNRGRPLKFL